MSIVYTRFFFTTKYAKTSKSKRFIQKPIAINRFFFTLFLKIKCMRWCCLVLLTSIQSFFFYFVQRLIALHVADTFVTVSFFCFVFFGVLFRISYSNWTQLVKKNCVFLCVFIFLFLLFGFHSMFHLFIFVVCLLVVVFFFCCSCNS